MIHAQAIRGIVQSAATGPGTEQSLNRENYKKAVDAQGADLLTTRLWFDVN